MSRTVLSIACNAVGGALMALTHKHTGCLRAAMIEVGCILPQKDQVVLYFAQAGKCEHMIRLFVIDSDD